MEIKRRSGSTFVDLDIIDGDASWYVTDRYNASGPERLGGGRLRIRDVEWKGDKILGFGDTDYSLKVSSSKGGPQFWAGNQAGRETDAISLAIFVDGALTPLEPGDAHSGVGTVEIRHTTLLCLDDAARTPFAAMAWRAVWQGGVYTFSVDVTYLSTVYRWHEYVSNTGVDGACGSEAAWKCDRVKTDSSDHTGLGCHGEPSNWLWDPPGKAFELFLGRSDGGKAKVRVVADAPIPQLTNDHGDNLVITYHVTNDGQKPVVQSRGDTAHHEHTITIAEI